MSSIILYHSVGVQGTLIVSKVKYTLYAPETSLYVNINHPGTNLKRKRFGVGPGDHGFSKHTGVL